MPGVIIHFTRELPFRVQLKGEWWTIGLSYNTKRTKASVYAECDADHRIRCLVKGHHSYVESCLLRGITVDDGTPEKGLANALRRTGCVWFEVPADSELNDFGVPHGFNGIVDHSGKLYPLTLEEIAAIKEGRRDLLSFLPLD